MQRHAHKATFLRSIADGGPDIVAKGDGFLHELNVSFHILSINIKHYLKGSLTCNQASTRGEQRITLYSKDVFHVRRKNVKIDTLPHSPKHSKQPLLDRSSSRYDTNVFSQMASLYAPDDDSSLVIITWRYIMSGVLSSGGHWCSPAGG